MDLFKEIEYFHQSIVYISKQTSRSILCFTKFKKMNNQILRTILFGALLGAALFAAPFFLFKVLLFFLFFGLIFRLFRGRRFRGGWKTRGWAYADKIRQMDDQEYKDFKENYRQYCGPGNFDESQESESESESIRNQKTEEK